MDDGLSERVKTVLRALLTGKAQLSSVARQEILDRAAGSADAAGRSVPPALAAYAERVTNAAYKITDDDVQKLRAAGHSEDEIFESTLIAAFGAGLKRLRKGLSLLRGVA
jgi:alkylhydroperoxidase family enzyme